MKPIVRDFLVGATAILSAAGLIGMLVFFGEINLQKYYRFNVRLTDAAGLTSASRVMLNGVSIGQIVKTDNLPPATGGVSLEIKVKQGVDIPRSSVIQIEKGLIGEASMNFTVAGGLAPALASDTIKQGETFDGGNPMSPFDRLFKAAQEPLAKLGQTAEKIDRLADVYSSLGERLSDAVEPRTLADVAAGKSPNLRSALERLDHAVAGADGWLNDADLRNQIKGIAAKADSVMGDVTEAVRTVRSAADKASGAIDSASGTIKSMSSAAGKLDEKIGGLADQALAMLRTTEDAAGKLAQTLDAATSGKGTMGQLMQNPDLYNSLRDAAQRLDRTLVEAQLLIEKVKAEGVKIGL